MDTGAQLVHPLPRELESPPVLGHDFEELARYAVADAQGE